MVVVTQTYAVRGSRVAGSVENVAVATNKRDHGDDSEGARSALGVRRDIHGGGHVAHATAGEQRNLRLHKLI